MTSGPFDDRICSIFMSSRVSLLALARPEEKRKCGESATGL